MKRLVLLLMIGVCLLAFGLHDKISSSEITQEECFFLSSLHYTAKGMDYWYDKDNGGLETVTGIPYSNLDCKKCHTPACDSCHRKTTEGKPSYSSQTAQNQETCLHCHGRQASVLKIDKASNQENVHIAKGMQCMDCHTAREMHGDGIEYKSFKQKGVMDIQCEKCHPTVTPSISHKVHRDGLDCKACHVRHVLSCSNCHFETDLKENKRLSIPLTGWVFLMNYNGRVTSATMQNFVLPANKTFLMFAPRNSHSIMKQGRNCGDCHGTEIVRQVEKGKIRLTWLENGNVKNIKGVIPVVNRVIYEAVYQDYKDGKWMPIENPPPPVLQYVGYGEPLSDMQLKKLAMPMGKGSK